MASQHHHEKTVSAGGPARAGLVSYLRVLERKHGSSTLPYGLLIGLISVVALGAVTSIGDQTTSLFDDVAGNLSGTVQTAGGSAGSGGEQVPDVPCTAPAETISFAQMLPGPGAFSVSVPAECDSVTIQAWGAGGGGSGAGSTGAIQAGAGGYMAGSMAVTPGESFSIEIGQGGGAGRTVSGTDYRDSPSLTGPAFGGWPDGGDTGSHASVPRISGAAPVLNVMGAGGGGTRILYSGGLVMVAGGGGGGASRAGGGGGWPNGGDGGSFEDAPGGDGSSLCEFGNHADAAGGGQSGAAAAGERDLVGTQNTSNTCSMHFESQSTDGTSSQGGEGAVHYLRWGTGHYPSVGAGGGGGLVGGGGGGTFSGGGGGSSWFDPAVITADTSNAAPSGNGIPAVAPPSGHPSVGYAGPSTGSTSGDYPIASGPAAGGDGLVILTWGD